MACCFSVEKPEKVKTPEKHVPWTIRLRHSLGLFRMRLTQAAKARGYGNMGQGEKESRLIDRKEVDYSRWLETNTVVHDQSILWTVRDSLKFDEGVEGEAAGHTHALRAQVRRSAERGVANCARRLGRQVHDVFSSRRRVFEDGTKHRSYHTYKDLTQGVRFDAVPKDAVINITHAEHFLTVEQLERYTGHLIILSAVQPKSVAGGDDEGYYVLNSDGTHEEWVQGGAHYKHTLFDYSSDTILLEFPQRSHKNGFVLYQVHTVPSDKVEHQALVALVPLLECSIPIGVLKRLNEKYTGHPWEESFLRRADGAHASEGFLTTTYMRGGRSILSIRRENSYSDVCVDVDRELLRGVKTLSSKSRIYGLSAVRSIIESEGAKYTDTQVVIIIEYLSVSIPTERPTNYALNPTIGDSLIADSQPSAIPCPGIPEIYYPVRTPENAEEAIRTRVTNVINTVEPDDEIKEAADAFIDVLIPERLKHTLTPLTDPETREICADNPKKFQKYLQEAFGVNRARAREVVKAFLKVDPSKAGKPSRVIYPTATKLLVELSSYMYPLKEFLKNRHPSFLPGSKPEEIAEAVHQFTRHLHSLGLDLGETDFKKFDGTISEWLRSIYQRILTRVFKQEFTGAIQTLLNKHTDMKIILTVAMSRQVFSSGFMNLSGAADTTVLNTLLNMLVNFVSDYLALREANIKDPARTAWTLLGPKFGDDGLCGMFGDPADVAKRMGLSLEIQRRPTTEHTHFLSRLYPRPVESRGSTSIITRALQRIPVTTNPDPIEGLRRKVFGYEATDAESPVIGSYLGALKRAYALTPLGEGEVEALSRDEKIRFDTGPWPALDALDEEVAVDLFRNELGWGPFAVEMLVKGLDEVETVDDLAALEAYDIGDKIFNREAIWVKSRRA